RYPNRSTEPPRLQCTFYSLARNWTSGCDSRSAYAPESVVVTLEMIVLRPPSSPTYAVYAATATAAIIRTYSVMVCALEHARRVRYVHFPGFIVTLLSDRPAQATNRGAPARSRCVVPPRLGPIRSALSGSVRLRSLQRGRHAGD